MGFDARYELTSPSGARIDLVWREAEGAALAVVHVSHGLGEQASDIARIADLLTAGGFHVYVHDHRGHGATRAPDALPGHFGSGDAAEKVLADMQAVEDFVAGRHAGLPVILFGCAAGGLIALTHLLRHPQRIAGLVFENPPAWFGPGKRALLAWERFRLGSDVPSRAMNPEASVGSWRAVVAMQDQVFRRRHEGPALCHAPVLILIDDAGGAEGRKNAEALAIRLKKRGFPDMTTRRHEGTGEAVAAVFRDWTAGALGR